MTSRVEQGEAAAWLLAQPANSADLMLTSPPYEDARLYGDLGFKLRDQDWVDWMVGVVKAASPVVTGLMAVVCEGKTSGFRYSAVPALLMADLHRAGFVLRKPPIFHRSGISGSGGPDWLRNDYEFVVCVTRKGRLPWSNNTACGGPPKYKPCGRMSHRTKDGSRVGRKLMTRDRPGTHSQESTIYVPPDLANPGNVIRVPVGGGRMGHPLAHDNEAPMALGLAEFFVKSFCPPGGKVIDPFAGSGTTGHASLVHGRHFSGCDLRPDQVDLARRRLADVAGKISNQELPGVDTGQRPG